MKAKKAIKKLTHAEKLLAEVVDDFEGAGKPVLEAVTAAKASVLEARLNVEKLRDAEPEAKKTVTRRRAPASKPKRAKKTTGA